MNIHPLTQAIAAGLSAQPEKVKSAEVTSLDLRSHGWSEGSDLLKSINQTNGVTSLHGLVVHGAACASLLALGSMAAAMRESSYELVMARATHSEPTGELIARWPTMAAQLQPFQQEHTAEPAEEKRAYSIDAYADETILNAGQSEDVMQDVMLADTHTDVNPLDSTSWQFTPLADEALWLAAAENDAVVSPVVHFSFDVFNQQQESLLDAGVVRENRPRFEGQAQPGSLIELVNQNGELLGTSLVDASGQWYIIPLEPLANGEHELRLFITDASGERELAVAPIHLVIAVEPPVLEPIIELVDAPSLSLLPMIETEPGLNLTLIAPPESEQINPNFAFGLSDLLPMNEPELLFSDAISEEFMLLDESALQLLIHPQGGITLWEQQEDLALSGLEYSPTAAISSSDPLFADLMANNDH